MIAGRTRRSEGSRQGELAAQILLAGVLSLALQIHTANAGDGWGSTPGWEPAARVGVAFHAPFLPTPETLRGVDTALGLYRKPECYWLAAAQAAQEKDLSKAWAQAYALQAALIERDLLPSRVVAWARVSSSGDASAAEVRIYCSPPSSLSLTFEKASSALNQDIRTSLEIVTASVPQRNKALVIRGFATPEERTDPLKLAIDRAITLRHRLIESDYPGKLIQIEADTRTPPADGSATNAEILIP